MVVSCKRQDRSGKSLTALKSEIIDIDTQIKKKWDGYIRCVIHYNTSADTEVLTVIGGCTAAV